MFVSARRHKLEIDRLATELKSREEHIAVLDRRVIEAKRTRHEFIEEVRYVIEAGADHVSDTDSLRGERLKTLGHVLPYLLSGRRHWDDPEMPEIAGSAVLEARQLAAEFGFSLPDDPVHAVKAMFDLAMALFNPSLSLALKGLQCRHPLAASERQENESRVPNQRWIEHAYPLKRITVQAQGTRHSDLKDMADQLREIAGLIDAGHLIGQDDDDDFGYCFTVEVDKTESIFPDR